MMIYLDAGSLWEGMDQEERIWNQMSDEEKMHRLKDLQRRIFLDIGNKGNNQDSIKTYSGCRLYQYYKDIKTPFLFKFSFLIRIFHIASLLVNKEKLLIDKILLFSCLCE